MHFFVTAGQTDFNRFFAGGPSSHLRFNNHDFLRGSAIDNGRQRFYSKYGILKKGGVWMSVLSVMVELN